MNDLVIGCGYRRKEDPRLLSGRGRYTADVRPARCLEVAILRSRHAHARIAGVDVTAARQTPGVFAAFSGAELALPPMPTLLPHPALKPVPEPVLAVDRVRYVGEGLAAVVAESRYRAEDALDAIHVDYEPLPALTDVHRALAAGATAIHDSVPDNLAARMVQHIGDADRAFRDAPYTLRTELRFGRASGQPIEPRAVVAAPDETGTGVIVWSSTQTPHLSRRLIASVLGLAEHQVRVIAGDVGGGFGAKLTMYPEEALLAALALRLGRPVRWIEDRVEHLQTCIHEREQLHEAEIAFDDEGRFLGVRARFLHDQGAYAPWGIVVPTLTATTLPGPYVLPNYTVEMLCVLTNKAPAAPIRGAGRPQGTAMMEQLADLVAARLQLDPAEVRRRNFIQPEQFPYEVGLTYRDGSKLIYDSGNYPACLDEVMRVAGYDALRAEQARARAEGRLYGIGFGCYVEGTGLGPYERAAVRIDPSGRVTVFSGAGSQGQGLETTLAQAAARELGISPDEVEVIVGDTSRVGEGIGTFASRNAAVTGTATSLAAADVREKAKRLAAVALEAAVDDLVVQDGRVWVRGVPERSITLGALAAMTEGAAPGSTSRISEDPGLSADRAFRPAQPTFASGVHLCAVEVDAETGVVTIQHYAIVHDCGVVVNPLIVEGQTQGALAHGIGNALFEEIAYDEQGQLLTGTFMDYLLPAASDVPAARLGHVVTPTPVNPQGVKGAGEGGTIPAPAAILAAVSDALSPLGARVTAFPLTPERVLTAIRQRSGQPSAA